MPAAGPGGPPALPGDAVALAHDLRAGLERALDVAPASLFLYGALAFARPPGWRVDFDFHVLVARHLRDEERHAVGRLYGDLAAAHPLGADLDGWFVLLDDAARAEPPPCELDPAARDESWALHRAHVHAGRFHLVAGIDPRTVVPEPTWPELAAALRAELGFVEHHPQAAAYGVLNGCRILSSLRTREVVVSKHAAGTWALDALPRWRPAIAAALRAYTGAEAAGDDALLRDQWAPFVGFVRAAADAEP